MDVIFWTSIVANSMAFRGIGPYQLAGHLRSKGYDCQVIDFIHWMDAETLVIITERFITNKTVCLGLSCTFWSEWSDTSNRFKWTPRTPSYVRDALEIIKERYPHIKIVLGGSMADIVPAKDHGLYDLIIMGEAEDSFYEVLEEWRKGRKQIFATEYKTNTPYITAAKNNTYKIEDNNHRFIEQDCIVDGESLPIEISRGCIFKCKFCQYPHIGKTKYDYLRRFELIKEEIEHNYKNFKSTNYYILDDTFNDSDFKMQAWKQITDSLDFKLNFTAYLRADLLKRKEEHISLLQESGLMSAFFGVESFHPDASRLVGKGWSGKEGKEFFLKLKDRWGTDVTQHLSLIVGLPPETREDYMNTHAWLKAGKFDNWVWNRLFIVSQNRHYSSDFDRDPGAFGYTIDENGRWKTNTMTQQDADKITDELNSDIRFQTKHTAWHAISLLNYGIPREHLQTRLKHSFTHLIMQGRPVFFQKYLNKLKNISV